MFNQNAFIDAMNHYNNMLILILKCYDVNLKSHDSYYLNYYHLFQENQLIFSFFIFILRLKKAENMFG